LKSIPWPPFAKPAEDATSWSCCKACTYLNQITHAGLIMLIMNTEPRLTLHVLAVPRVSDREINGHPDTLGPATTYD